MSGRRGPREGLLLPILIPVGALVIIGASLWGFSRVLLEVSPAAATGMALVAAAGIMVVAAYVTSRKEVTGSSLLSLVGGVLGVTMVAGGAALLLGVPGEEEGQGPFVVALSAPVGAATDGFSTDVLTAPAGEPFVIRFTSEDPVVHNVDIALAEGESPIFTGPDVLGPGGSADNDIEPLDVGEYVFYCKYHVTTMAGTLTVEEAPAGGQEGLTVVASGIAFDTDTIELAADTESTVTLRNEDPGTVHNIAIYTDDTASTVIFDGPDVTGPASVPYAVPPIEAGEYFFRCDTHPPMAGTVVVAGAEGEGAAAEDPGGG